MNGKTADWVMVALEEFAELDAKIQMPEWLKAEDWAWEDNAALNLVQAAMPAVGIRQGAILDARHFGALLGHALCLGEAVSAILCDTAEIDEAEKQMQEANEPLEQMQEMEKLLSDLKDLISARARLTEQILARAVSAPTDERRDFFRGFHSGLAAGSVGIKTRDNTLLLFFLLLLRPRILRFNSIRELHEWLSKKLGRNLVGNQKRLEKVFQRIGFRLREPGRPAEGTSEW
jgi:hypothetical protein